MTVRELIDALSKAPPEQPVFLCTGRGETAEIQEVHVNELLDDESRATVIE